MGKIIDYIYEIYITEETNCAETLFRATLTSRGQMPPKESLLMMSGFSGGVSTENLCGAIIGGVAAISYLINKGDDESFERSKEVTVEFYEAVEKRFQSTCCHEIKTEYRTEELRCLEAVKIMAEILESILEKNEL